ncbi:DUF5047 domain-containing protein [Amycolatopsis sp. NPDC003731]
MVARARIVAPGQIGVNPVGTEIPIISGDVTMDINADVTATLSLETQITWPAFPTALGTPYGQEIFVERGVEYGDGGTEWVGLGYFRIDSVEQDEVPNGTIHISASDRMAQLADDRPMSPIQFGAGASAVATIQAVAGQAIPGIPVVADWDGTFASSHVLDDDRVKFIRDIASSYGKIAYFDYAGRLQVKSAPDPTKASVFTVNAGRNGVMVKMKRALTRDGVYNAVVATGEGVGELPPVRGVATDDVPTSPTYFGGSFGHVPRFYSSSFLTTADQCTIAARAMLVQATGLPYAVSLGLVPNPALEAGDVLRVQYSERGLIETHIADKIVYPLVAGGVMTIETRKQYL